MTVLWLAASVAVSALDAKESGCTEADFKGVFGITVTGTVLPGLPISGVFGRLGRVVADGAGNTSVTSLADYNGFGGPNSPTTATVQEDFAGVYQVRDDCYLTWQATLPTGNLAIRFEGVIASDGNEVTLFVADPPGAVLVGSLKRAKEGACTVADFKGSFALQLSGTVVPGLPISGPFGRIGQVVADGAGAAAATTIASYTGAVLRENFDGPYQVSADCHVTWQTQLPPPVSLPIVIEGTILTGGSEVTIMITNPPGSVILGSLKKQ